jgi:hypothetical protein
MTDETLRERLAALLHLKLAAAQNLPYEDGDTCSDCIEDVETEFMPVIKAREDELKGHLRWALEEMEVARQHHFPQRVDWQMQYKAAQEAAK